MFACAMLMSFRSPSMEMILMPRALASSSVGFSATGSVETNMMPSGLDAITASRTRSCSAGWYCAGPWTSRSTPSFFAASVAPQPTVV